MTIAKVSPYEHQLIADANETIALRQQLADCPAHPIRKAALLGLFVWSLGYAVGYVSSVLL